MMERKPLDGTAFGVMVLCTALWGFQQVVIKLTAQDISFVMQAGIRSVIATVLLFIWVVFHQMDLWKRDGTLWPGIVAGLLFGGEFIFIYAGLEHTTASRMVVFIYLAPIFTALGLHLWVPGEKLVPGQWVGVLLSFAGIAFAFWEGFTNTRMQTLLGDVFGVIAAALWAATTVVIRATTLARISATKTLFYQLAVSALMLPVASVAMGEKGVVALTAVGIAGIAYQAVIVAFASYLAWFWLLTRYLAERVRLVRAGREAEARKVFEKEKGVEIVDFWFCALLGLMQHFSVPVGQLTEVGFDEGYGFDGSSIRGFQEIQESDMILVPDPNTETLIVILRDERHSDVLPIWVGAAEGNAIRMVLESQVPPRPMSHDLIQSVADHLGIKMSHVVVTDVKSNTYYATIHLMVNGVERTIDSRPSDAIALALRTRAPILVEETVIDNAKTIDFASERADSDRLQKWLESLDMEEFGKYRFAVRFVNVVDREGFGFGWRFYGQ